MNKLFVALDAIDRFMAEAPFAACAVACALGILIAVILTCLP